MARIKFTWLNSEYDSKNGPTNCDFSYQESIGSSKNPQANTLNNTKALENKTKSSKKIEIFVSYPVSVDTTKTVENGKNISNYYRSL